MDTNTYFALHNRIARKEGYDPTPRWDVKGATIGHGHQVPMTRSDFDLLFELPMTEELAEEILGNDIGSRIDELTERIACYSRLDSVRQAALVEMSFMGVTALLRFTNMLGALEDWVSTREPQYLDDVYREALDSQWAQDWGIRAREIAEMLRTGLWPGGLP